ncbi:MAG: Arm DNA-binding domain-containing protein, partial [Alphaproteobacteria bacterium]|nr:Arm DNA-binding domain-containing protein [Alphaproteobacteria bacterium]
MARFPFSDRKIDSLKVPAEGQIDHYDTRAQGLGIRLSYGGSKTWFVRYSHSGHRRRYGLGRFPAVKLADARLLALGALHTTMVAGSDPALERRAKLQSATLLTLAETYIEEYAKPKKRSWGEDNRILVTGPYFKRLHARRAIEVTRADIIERLQGIRKNNGGVMANRALAAIRGLYQWGIR